MPTVTDDYGNELIYNFVVDEITSEYVTITFTLKSKLKSANLADFFLLFIEKIKKV
jgi:hypothetical protein